MAFSYNKKNLANTTITGAITPTQTSVTVADATVFSYAFFYATLMPSNEMSNASNSEIVLVTNIQGNTLTLVRGQENTIARSFPYGAVITNGIYTRDIDYARSIGRKVFMARDDGTDDTNTSYQIIDPMIKNVPEEGSIITVEFDVPSYGAPTLGVNNGIGGLVQVSGTDIHITDSSGQIDSVELDGNTEQTTYSGKNLYESIPRENQGLVGTLQADGTVAITGKATSNYSDICSNATTNLAAGTYTFSMTKTMPFRVLLRVNDSQNLAVLEPGAVKGTFTVAYEITQLRVFFFNVTSGTTYNETVGFQLEAGSTQTSFEPYVGGTASPNPDYPQEVQTVTGRQVVTISDGGSQSQEYEINLGKNLLDESHMEQGTFSYIDGYGSAHTGVIRMDSYMPCQPNTTYTLSSDSVLGEVGVVYKDSSGTVVQGFSRSVETITSYSFTTKSNVYQMRVRVGKGAYPHTAGTDYKLQLELGSTATTYAPYFTPIELCKIGTYQDYIYKSGEDWYVKKNTKKLDMSTINAWVRDVAGRFYRVGFSSVYGIAPGVVYSNDFTYSATTWDGEGKFGLPDSGNIWLMISDTTVSQSDLPTWLGNKGAIMYGVISTPTDTQITNATLIAQLNALNNMLPEGVADVVVTGDLPGSLTIKYYQQGTGTHTAPIVGGAEIDGGDNEQVVELDSYLPYRLVYDTNGYWRVLNKGPKVTTGAIADGAVTPAKLSVDPGKYSAAETIIGSWIDGRPVYRKVLTGTTPNGGVTINHGITNFSRILNVYGWVQSGSNGSQPIQRVLPDAIAQYGIGVGDFGSSTFLLQVGTSSDVRGKPYTIILEYIKTV